MIVFNLVWFQVIEIKTESFFFNISINLISFFYILIFWFIYLLVFSI